MTHPKDDFRFHFRWTDARNVTVYRGLRDGGELCALISRTDAQRLIVAVREGGPWKATARHGESMALTDVGRTLPPLLRVGTHGMLPVCVADLEDLDRMFHERIEPEPSSEGLTFGEAQKLEKEWEKITLYMIFDPETGQVISDLDQMFWEDSEPCYTASHLMCPEKDMFYWLEKLSPNAVFNTEEEAKAKIPEAEAKFREEMDEDEYPIDFTVIKIVIEPKTHYWITTKVT